jgi:hypothetical protein
MTSLYLFGPRQICKQNKAYPPRQAFDAGQYLPSEVRLYCAHRLTKLPEILDRAKHEQFGVIPFEAYDGPRKGQWQGTVGGYWGARRQV